MHPDAARDAQALREDRIALWILEDPADAIEIAGDDGVVEEHVALRAKPFTHKDMIPYLRARGRESDAVGIRERAMRAVERPTDFRAGQIHFTRCLEAVVQHDVTANQDPFGGQRGTAGILDYPVSAVDHAAEYSRA